MTHPVRGHLPLSMIRGYTALANRTPGCIKLTLGEPDGETPLPIRQAAQAAMARGFTHYAPNQGDGELLQALAQYHRCRPEQILITAGATDAIYTSLMGVLCEGDEVIIPTPAFSLYQTVTEIAGGKAVCMDISENGFQISREMMDAAITEKTKVVVLNSPNNPTGTVLSEASLQAVSEAVAGKDIYILADGVYEGLCSVPCPTLPLGSRVLYCQSFSKPYAMTGWRIGYLIADERLISALVPLHAAQMAAVPTFVQKAAVAALAVDVSPMASLYEARRRYACGRLDGMGIPYPKPEGAFYIFADMQAYTDDTEDFCRRLITEAGVAFVPGTCFGARNYIRISYCCDDEALRQGLDRLEQYLKKRYDR